MKTLRALAVSLACLLASAVVSADVQKKTLLTSDGTLYQVQAGRVAELGISGPGLETDAFAVVWSSLSQDGTAAGGVIPRVANDNPKTSLDLTFDEPTQTLAVLWREESTILNSVRLAFLRAGAWSVADLLPHVGFPHAYNPQMLLTHSTVHTLDKDGGDVFTPRSILSIVWWEETGVLQARYASFFLDEAIDASSATVYDLADLVGAQGPTVPQELPVGAYAFPALQSDGTSGDVLVTFATLSTDQEFVVRLSYPTDLGRPSIGNMTWQRRRIPVVGIESQGPIFAGPVFGAASAVSTVVGSSYHPTLYWQDGPGVFYIRYDGTAWSAVRAIALTDDVTYDKAVALILSMAQRN